MSPISPASSASGIQSSGGTRLAAAAPAGQGLVGGDLAGAGVDQRLVVHLDLVAGDRVPQRLLGGGAGAQAVPQRVVEHLGAAAARRAVQGRGPVAQQVLGARVVARHHGAHRHAHAGGQAAHVRQPGAEVGEAALQVLVRVAVGQHLDHGQHVTRQPAERRGARHRGAQAVGDPAHDLVARLVPVDHHDLVETGDAAQQHHDPSGCRQAARTADAAATPGSAGR
ncbi:hypothetical protein GCM10025868_39030 [Angustibacter aerolatus]|uniref:Uncharacterized protein n=1 Tax=Angustibacter aerolatus TaxID=1162965 RepID=A0ABQ6JMQ0_9ACTN|nr:hypothetical protein GCM10025868_39030 [Angustibacter aerolatus]